MARIPYFDLEQASPTVREQLRARPPLNVYRMVAHGGPAGEGFLALGSALLRQGSLDPVLRELIILRVGALSDARYEIHQHRRVATGVGVTAEKIEAVLIDPGTPPSDGLFSPLEAAALRYCDAVVRKVKAPTELFDRLAGELTHQQLMELTMTIGFYMLVCRVLENFEVDIEPPMG